MKTVEIYIETSIKAPAVRDGKYAAALVFTKANGESAVRFVSGEEGETTILFLREKNNPEMPFYTMEVRDGQMIQCRAKYNGDMTEEVKAFVELFKRKKLRKQERKAG